MNFEYDETQAQLVELADNVLRAEAGPECARAILDGEGYDYELEAQVADLGLLDLATDDDAGPLEATFVIERVAYHQGLFAVGTRALVMPMLGLDVPGPLGLASGAAGQPLRFGARVRSVLVLTDSTVELSRVAECSDAGFMTNYAIGTTRLERVKDLGPQFQEPLARWWRIALSAEIVGLASRALGLTLSYVSERHQFGRPLGALQAIQHRLAEVYVAIEGARWQTRFAAFSETDNEAAAGAAVSAVEAARLTIWELHQLTGAIGFTKEYDLHLITMRLHALRVELDGVCGSHASSVADLRWELAREPAEGGRDSAMLATMSPRS